MDPTAQTPTSTPRPRASSGLPGDTQPCRECRRRKARCDGSIPVCSTCRRYKRHCLYDKHSRTPLTRKHLTEVEERLERAETILRQLFTADQVTRLLDQNNTDVGASINTALNDTAAPTDGNQLIQPAVGTSVPEMPTGASTTGQSFGWTSDQSTWNPEGPGNRNHKPPQSIELGYLGSLPLLDSDVLQNPQPSLEQAPSADDDFEWDEHDQSWAENEAGDGASMTDSMEGKIQKIMDGMGTLAVDDSSGGYLGITSGAALLRLTWMAGRGDLEGDTDARNQRRESLARLFSREASDHPSPTTWLRTQPLLTRTVVETLIDAYFGLYHPNFPILHEPTFRAQYANTMDRHGSGTWHVLANIVVAMGSFVSSTCSDDTDMTIFRAVKENLFIGSLESGNLTLVQAFALSANYLQKRNKPNSGYNYAGVALRLAIGLGLHKEFQGWKIAPLKLEIRRRVWWCLCVLDVGATITYGRPLNWPQAGVEAALPLNIHERDLTSKSTMSPQEAEEATLYTYIRVQATYHLRTMKIYNRLISNPSPSVEELISLDDELIGGWIADVPYYFRDDDLLSLNPDYALAHSIGRWRYRMMRTIMYRPFLIRWADQIDGSQQQSLSDAENLATERCLKAAKEVISSVKFFWTCHHHTRLAAWYVLYFLFQASLIPMHCLRRNPRHRLAADWRDQIQSTLDVVGNMSEMNASSSKCYDLIVKLCGPNLRTEQAGNSQFEGVNANFESTEDAWNWVTGINPQYNDFDMWQSPPASGLSVWPATGVPEWDPNLIM